jgi:hypothetical protein
MIARVGFEVFTAVTMKNAVFWDVAPCRSCVNQRFEGTYCLQLQDRKIRERGTSVSRWLRNCQIQSYFLFKTSLRVGHNLSSQPYGKKSPCVFDEISGMAIWVAIVC